MRNHLKRLAPLAFIAAVFLGASAIAQTTFRALQLSQDTSGTFSVDTNFGVYFPGHILSSGAGRPSPSVVGTGTPSVVGTDTAGTITMGSSATTAGLTFGQQFLSTPSCTLSWQNNLTAMTYTLASTIINITQTSTSGNKINYLCFSIS